MGKTAWVYILTNKRDGVLYVGVTSDLQGRMANHDLSRFAGRASITRTASLLATTWTSSCTSRRSMVW